jgi:hypothetical protein
MDTAIVSGPGRQLAAVAPALAAHGVDLRVVVFQYAGAAKSPYRAFLEAAGVDHVVVPFASRFDRALLRNLRGVLDAWAPDVVQTHGYRPTALAWLLRRAGAPVAVGRLLPRRHERRSQGPRVPLARPPTPARRRTGS